MERRQLLLVGGIVLVLIIGGYLLYGQYSVPIPSIDKLEQEIVLNDLGYEQHVTSPLSFSGEAAPEWFDNGGTFSIEVRDSDGTILGEGKAQAQDQNSTQMRMPFTATVDFVDPDTKEGSVWLFRSGTFGNDDSFSYGVNVSFVPVEQAEDQAAESVE